MLPTLSGLVVLFLYGGGWKSGDRRTYHFVGSALASRGITTVIPDYRLFPEVRFPSFVDDAALAYDWIRRNIASRGGKPRPIIVFGHSAGAHSGALLAYDRRYLASNSLPSPPPTLVMHGLDDDTVRLWNTRTLAEALSKAGAKIEKREFSDIGHVGVIVAMARPFRWRAPVLTEAITFIRGISGSTRTASSSAQTPI